MAEQLVREPQLLVSLIGDVTVGESYFFRLQAHFAALVAAARRVLARPQSRFCVWSAGCAAGEEPYSIALALREALSSSELSRIRITGTDVDRSAIATAESGIYGAWAFRGMDPAWLERGFRKLPDGRYQLLSDVRHLVTFRHAPLSEHLALVPAESLDAILFRNVSVYLTEAANQLLYEGFARILRQGGLLFVAPTDIRPKLERLRAFPSQDFSVFECVAAQPPEVPQLAAESSIPLPASARRPILGTPPPPHATTSTPSVLLSEATEPWRRIDELADHGEISAALTLLATLAKFHGDTADFSRRRGRLYLARGDAASAVDDFRRVLYLVPDDCATRYWYALALRQAGQPDAARHHLGLIVRARPSCDERLSSTAECLMGELA